MFLETAKHDLEDLASRIERTDQRAIRCMFGSNWNSTLISAEGGSRCSWYRNATEMDPRGQGKG